MDKTKFQAMSIPEKLLFTLQYGSEVLVIPKNQLIIRVYGLADFFVEILYFSATNKVDSIVMISFEDFYEKYANEIDISGFLPPQ